MQLTITIRWKWIALALLLACVLLLRWAPKGLGRIDYVDYSPNGVYRVEIWSPSVFSTWSWRRFGSAPGFARVYSSWRHELIGETEIFDMNGNGEISWPRCDRLSVVVGLGDGSHEVPLPPGSPPGECLPGKDGQPPPPCRCD